MNQSILSFLNFTCLLIHIERNGVFTQELLSLCLLLFLGHCKMPESGSLIELPTSGDSEKMTYTEQASKRHHCMRLTW